MDMGVTIGILAIIIYIYIHMHTHMHLMIMHALCVHACMYFMFSAMYVHIDAGWYVVVIRM